MPHAVSPQALSNGLLVSFFTFLHGTIDLHHLPPASPDGPAAAASSDWRKQYTEGAKLRARLLYVDPTTKRAGLSLLPHLVALSLPSPVPMLGSVFPDAEVQRVELGGPGLLMRLPGLPEGPVPAYCHVSDALEPEGAEGVKDGDRKGKGKGRGKEEGKEARDAAVAELNSKFKVGHGGAWKSGCGCVPMSWSLHAARPPHGHACNAGFTHSGADLACCACCAFAPGLTRCPCAACRTCSPAPASRRASSGTASWTAWRP